MTQPAQSIVPLPSPAVPVTPREFADISAETSLLGRILNRGPQEYSHAAHLMVSDFSSRAHQLVWHAIQKADENGPVNYSSVEGQLTNNTIDKGPDKGRRPIDVVGAEYLQSLLTYVSGDTAECVKRVAYTSMMRKGQKVIDDMHRILLDTRSSLDARADHMLSLTTAYGLQVQSLKGRKTKTLVDAIADHAAVVDERRRALSSGELAMFGASSAFNGMQDLLKGYKRRKLYLVVSRPGLGKSAFALNEALNAMKQGLRVVFVTLEMDIEELMDRLIAIESGVGADDIESGNLSADDVRRLAEAQDRLMGYETASKFVYLDFPPRPKMSQIEARLREHIAIEGADVIFFDQASDEMLSPERPSLNAIEKLSDAAAVLKGWSKTFNIPVIAMGQLNRDTDKNPNAVPTLGNLSSSSSLEKSADVVMALHYPDGSATTQRVYAIDATVLKHRGGRKGVAHLNYISNCTKFEDRP